MLTGLDHVIVAVPSPDDAAEVLERELGLRAGAGGRHEAHGTFNRLVWLGDSYIELMGVFDAHLAGQSWWGRHALAVLARGAGMMGVALASDDASADAELLREGGSTLGTAEADERVRPDGRAVRWQLAHAPSPDPDLGLAFLITHDEAAAEWTPAERAARRDQAHPLGTPVSLRRVDLPVHDIRAATLRLHRELGLAFRPSLAGAGARETSVGQQALRLTRSGERPRLVLAGGSQVRDRQLLGCAWVIEPAT